jgi:hypothetical protein
MKRLKRFVLKSIASTPKAVYSPEPNKSQLVGVVIPTLVRDLIQLEQAVTSALANNCVGVVVLVTPSKNKEKLQLFSNKSAVEIIFDELPGFTNAMNIGVNHLNKMGYKYFSGIGDDDLLAPNFLDSIIVKMESQGAQVGLGTCYYVNNYNQIIFRNSSPLYLLRILHLIPNIIPAPGALIRTSSWVAAGGFNPRFKYVADFDFWMKIRGNSKFTRLPIPMSYFRWHDLGLTAGNREASRAEALLAQRNYIPRSQVPLFYTFTKASYLLGDFVMRISMRSSFKADPKK